MSFRWGIPFSRSSSRARAPLATLISSAALLFTAGSANAAPAQFQDVTAQTNTTYTGESYGASWGDKNGDGWPDLFVSHHRNTPSVYVNMGDGTFIDRWNETDVWQTLPNLDQHGAAWADFDNDGDQDLFVSLGATDHSQFLINDGQILSDKIQDYGFDKIGWSGRLPTWVDYTHDGFLDFTLANRGGKLQTLKQVPGQAPVDSFMLTNGASGHVCNNNQFAQLADLTGDKELELICSEQAPHPNKVYDTSTFPFTDVTGIVPPAAVVADSVLADFDGNLKTDMILIRGAQRVSGAEITGPNTVEGHLITDGDHEKGFDFVSDGDLEVQIFWSGRNPFAVHIGAAGTDLGSQPGEGSKTPLLVSLSASDPGVIGIQPHDTLADRGIYIGFEPSTSTWSFNLSPGNTWNYAYFYVTSSTNVSNLQATGLTYGDQLATPILIKDQNGTYVDVTAQSGLTEALQCISGVPGDFDNDMDVDLFVVCRGAINNLVDRYYDNQGDGTFTRVTNFGAEGPTGIGVGLGENVVVADYDVDGFLDLFVMNGLKLYPEVPFDDSGPDKMYRNEGNGNHWIQLDLLGTTANRDGVGAKVYVTANGVTQLREQNGGYHRWAQDSQRLHFGLAGNTSVDTIEVHWPKPSTQVDTYTNVAADALYRITEGGDIELRTLSSAGIPAPCGIPDYDRYNESGMFIWKDCNSPTDDWHVRVVAHADNYSFRGSVVSDMNFNSVDSVSLEPNDILDVTTNPMIIDYVMAASNGGIDGFDFTAPQGADQCLYLNSPTTLPIYAGAIRQPLTSPFNLSTLATCAEPPVTPTVFVGNAFVTEDDASGEIVFTIALSEPTTNTVTVNVSTMDDTATAPADYEEVTPQTLTFAPGETSKTLAVSIVNDEEIEGVHSFELVLDAPINAVLSGQNPGATGIIFDDDMPSLAPYCSKPVYDKTSEQGIFVWKDCPNGEWHVRLTAGGTSANYEGQVIAPQDISSLVGVSIEGADVLDNSDPSVIDFQLTMAGSGQDGFDFGLASDADVCFMLSVPSNANIYVGVDRNPVTAPFDLVTLGACGNTPTEPAISIADVNVSEDIASGIAAFTLTLSETSSDTITVDVATIDGSATAPEDYATTQQSISFAPGETSKTLDVAIVDDSLDEGEHSFIVSLSNPINATLGNALATATISDDDGAASPCGKPSYNTGNEAGVLLWKDCTSGQWSARMIAGGVGSAIYSGTLTSDEGFNSLIPFSIEGPDVFDNSDPNTLSYALRVNAYGQDGFDFSVATDAGTCFTLASPTMTVLIGMDKAPMNSPFDLATLGACDSTPPVTPEISITDTSTVENIASGLATFDITLSEATSVAVSVEAATTNGSATSPQDYASSQQTITFAPGQTDAVFEVSVVDDSEVESTEQFTVNLSSPSNATLGDSSATASIIDDDVAPPTPAISIADVSAAEDIASGVAAFSISLSTQTSVTVSVDVSTTDGSATAPADYQSEQQTVTFAPGETNATFEVTLINDTEVEATEQFSASLSNPSNATLANASATASILDDDVAPATPEISIADVSAAEDIASGIAVFTVSLSTQTSVTVSVDAATADGSATAPGDYLSEQQTITFAPGQTSALLNVGLVDDMDEEATEQFTVNLSNPSNATLADASATATISDDDQNTGVSPCSQPSYDKANEQGVFIWRDCPNGDWHARMTAGGSSVVYRGTLSDDQNLSNLTGFSIESNDILDNTTDAKVLTFQLAMANSGHDGFNVSLADASGSCFDVTSPPGVPVYLGADRTLVTPPFDLQTLGACDGAPPPTPTVSIANATVAENIGSGVATLSLSLSPASSDTVSVDVTTANGSATAGSDYQSLSQTLTFAPGQTNRTVQVDILDDTDDEGNETFQVNLSNAVNAVIADGSSNVTIVDNDSGGSISPCGKPTYYKSIQKGVFVWQDCTSGRWSMRMTAGGESVVYQGKLASGQDLINVSPFSIEGNDTLDNSDPEVIEFVLHANGSAQDGFDVSLTSGADACFGVTAPGDVAVYLGRDRAPVTTPFNLETLSACTLP